MFEYVARFLPSIVGGGSATSSVTFGTDLTQDPVFLRGSVKSSESFAQMMLVLGTVVNMQDARRESDHTKYQAWVRNQYVAELLPQLQRAKERLAVLSPQRLAAASRVQQEQAQLQELTQGLDVARRKYYSWLYDNDRELWYILDPIVSVQQDSTIFEAFSLDESTYVRVTLPYSQLELESAPTPGTTNIDFSLPLEREFSRTRSFRPLTLQVGAESVGVATEANEVIEKKIDLPETWVQGLVEVQAALSLKSDVLTLSSRRLSAVLARLESQRERRGPRALRLVATPGEPLAVVLEPWDETFALSEDAWEGEPLNVRIWGRRRLRVLSRILPHVETIELRVLGDGMPTFWSVTIDEITLTLGLSGWTAQDWASKARFAALNPSEEIDEEELEGMLDTLTQLQVTTVSEFAVYANLTPAQASSTLNQLCAAGAALFEPQTGRYVHRQLFPQINFAKKKEAGREERFGVSLARSNAVTNISQARTLRGREIRAQVHVDDAEHDVMLTKDADLRVTFAQCNCGFFRHNQMRLGPCRHIVATSLAVDAQ